MVHIELDVDRFSKGRDPKTGEYKDYLLKQHYPYVKMPENKDSYILADILNDHFMYSDEYGWYPYLYAYRCIFFLDEEDAHLFRSLLYIY